MSALWCWIVGHVASVDYTYTSGAVLTVPDGPLFTILEARLLADINAGHITKVVTHPCARCGKEHPK